jgi:hypothetical protein
LSGVRGSSWSSVFIVGAGAPAGVRAPWAKPRAGRARRIIEAMSGRMVRRRKLRLKVEVEEVAGRKVEVKV